jgi:putative transport protein
MEVDDRDLLDLTADMVDVVVTNKAIDGRTLAELAREETARGVFLRDLHRSGHRVGVLPNTVVNRGDVLTLVGSATSVARAARSSESPIARPT